MTWLSGRLIAVVSLLAVMGGLSIALYGTRSQLQTARDRNAVLVAKLEQAHAAVQQAEGANERLAQAVAEQNRRMAALAAEARAGEEAAKERDRLVTQAAQERRQAANERRARVDMPSPEEMQHALAAALGR